MVQWLRLCPQCRGPGLGPSCSSSSSSSSSREPDPTGHRQDLVRPNKSERREAARGLGDYRFWSGHLGAGDRTADVLQVSARWAAPAGHAPHLSRGPEGSKWLAGGSGSGNPGSRLGVNPTSQEAELGIGQEHQVNGSSLESRKQAWRVSAKVKSIYISERDSLLCT